jgi:hypothetical protein
MAAHVSKVFEHQLGSFASSSLADSSASAASSRDRTATAATAAPIALATLLANPQNLQSAIILNEILQRPEHRW